ncbi:MAG: dehydrogenase E1 component subunit alpha/beta [Planctomycetes bacterium]|nr:dehydrogenase E1 component subunit alpha/beta [Planctomycetota bacterium]
MSPPPPGKDRLLSLYRKMVLIRRCEEQLAKSHQRGLIHGACHTYVGQEAIAVGVCAHLRTEDAVFSTHRGHGHALAKGVSAEQLIAELYGRATGCSRGRGGSMHLFAPEVGMMGTSGIVGPCILQAAGAGYSFRLLKRDNVGVAFFGDGAVNNGAFHEGLNLASIWKLPAVFVCENNEFATEVPFKYSAGNPTVASRAASYGMAGVDLDGNDVLAIHAAATDAIERARQGGGPTLLECRTYRTRAHAEGMGDFTYRTREEVEAWKPRCPIARLRAHLLGAALASETELANLDAEISAEVEAAHGAAEKASWPDPACAATHVFAGPARPVTTPPTPAGAREISYMQATLEALSFEMKHNPRIFVLGEGIGQRGGNFKTTAGLYDLYGPERLRDTPISERGFVGLGGGAAMTGSRPVIDFMFADFVLDAVGEIINQIAKIQYMSDGRIKMPILLRGCIGIGHSAATHHSGNYYPMYAHFPGLRVVVPSTPYDAKGLLHHALRCDDPVLFLEHRELLSLKGSTPEGDYEIPFGQAAVVREGKDVTVVALALMVQHVLKASATLAAEGISVELIDPRTVAPLDVDTIAQSVRKTGRLLIVDEAFMPFGIGAEIAAQIADRGFDDLDAPVRRLNGVHTPTPYSPTLESAVVPNVEQIAQAIRSLVSE